MQAGWDDAPPQPHLYALFPVVELAHGALELGQLRLEVCGRPIRPVRGEGGRGAEGGGERARGQEGRVGGWVGGVNGVGWGGGWAATAAAKRGRYAHAGIKGVAAQGSTDAGTSAGAPGGGTAWAGRICGRIRGREVVSCGAPTRYVAIVVAFLGPLRTLPIREEVEVLDVLCVGGGRRVLVRTTPAAAARPPSVERGPDAAVA